MVFLNISYNKAFNNSDFKNLNYGIQNDWQF